MEIKVLGTGCASCKKLYAAAEKAISESGQPATLSKVESIEEIIGYGVMRTPALVIDGRVVSQGATPNATEIAALITSVATAPK